MDAKALDPVRSPLRGSSSLSSFNSDSKIWIWIGGGAVLVAGALILLWPSSAEASEGSTDLRRPRAGGTGGLRPHVDVVLAAAAQVAVSPLLVAAHIMQESGGDEFAIRVEVAGALESSLRRELQARADSDPAGFLDALDRGDFTGQARTASVGLLQILPETARGVGFTGASRDLLVPTINLRFGSKYIATNLRRYGKGNPLDEIAAYNAGSVKLATPEVAAALWQAAANARKSPCAYTAASSNTAVKAAIVAAGGSFELATSGTISDTLRSQGKTAYCNQEYVDGVLSWATALEEDYSVLSTIGTFLSGLYDAGLDVQAWADPAQLGAMTEALHEEA